MSETVAEIIFPLKSSAIKQSNHILVAFCELMYRNRIENRIVTDFVISANIVSSSKESVSYRIEMTLEIYSTNTEIC